MGFGLESHGLVSKKYSQIVAWEYLGHQTVVGSYPGQPHANLGHFTHLLDPDLYLSQVFYNKLYNKASLTLSELFFVWKKSYPGMFRALS